MCCIEEMHFKYKVKGWKSIYINVVLKESSSTTINTGKVDSRAKHITRDKVFF